MPAGRGRIEMFETSLRDGEVFVHDRFRFAVTPLKDSFAKLFVDA